MDLKNWFWEAVQAVRAYDCEVVLVGDSEIIKKLLEEYNAADERKITVHHSSEVINMDEHPGIAVKTKKDASIVVATKLLRDKECDALVSSGSTGAAVAAALFGTGTHQGHERPAIATPIPSLTGTTVVLDSGAKVDRQTRHNVAKCYHGQRLC